MTHTPDFALPNNFWWRIARRLRPNLDNRDPTTYLIALMQAIPVVITGPFALIGIIWLIATTTPSTLLNNGALFVLLAVICAIMEFNSYTVQIELSSGQQIPIVSSLNSVVVRSAGLIFGPTGLWLTIIIALTASGREFWLQSRLKLNPTWQIASRISQNGAGIFANLVGLAIYRVLGGNFPLTGLAFADWVPALVAITTIEIIAHLISLPLLIEIMHLDPATENPRQMATNWWNILIVYSLVTSLPFGLLGALIYGEANGGLFVLYASGLLLVNQLAHFLSRTNERSQQRARELAKLEALGEALIQAPSDLSTLDHILHEHIEHMFPQDRLELRLYGREVVEPPAGLVWEERYRIYPTDRLSLPDTIWDDLCALENTHTVFRNVIPNELTTPFGDALAVKIEADDPGEEGGEKEVLLGGICLLRHKTDGKPDTSLAALQALASQIGSAYYRANVHVETLAAEKMTQELAFAGRIQATFLPRTIPAISGWDIAAGLIPARQTSGDFYDFVPLADDRWGVVVADVADKGTGAALYMALSRTLIRTFAMQHPAAPETVLAAANARILSDAESDQFVTVFYGILDPAHDTLCYANAGHNPGFVVHNGTLNTLKQTGAPLGMFDDLQWQQNTISIAAGQVMALYSDGISEAQNSADEEFGEDRLIKVMRTHATESASTIHAAIINAVETFVGDAPQFDDMTLVVAVRK